MKIIISLPCVSGIWTNLTWLWWFGFRHEPISGMTEPTKKIFAHDKSSQKRQKVIIWLLSPIKVQSESLIHSVRA